MGPILLRKELKTLQKAEGAFLSALTDHVGEAAESGGLRTEGPVWVQFCCKKPEGAPEGRSKLWGQERYPATNIQLEPV